MATETLWALIMYGFVTSITPGPNNIMLMASGANFGVKRTIPHMFGISSGYAFMILVVGLGIISLFNMWPASYTVLKILSVAYMLWFAWKIARSSAPEVKQGNSKPFSFLQAAAFQWVNPKAWAMAMGAITIYAPDRDYHSVLWLALILGLVNLPSVGVWTFIGHYMQRLLGTPTCLRIFNWTMATLLVGSLALMV